MKIGINSKSLKNDFKNNTACVHDKWLYTNEKLLAKVSITFLLK